MGRVSVKTGPAPVETDRADPQARAAGRADTRSEAGGEERSGPLRYSLVV